LRSQLRGGSWAMAANGIAEDGGRARASVRREARMVVNGLADG
jgi:hypothetical protein